MSTPWIEMTMTTYQEMKADNEKLREENSQLKDEIEKLNKMKSIKWSREFACPEIKKLREKIQHLEKENERLKICFNAEESDEECPYCENGGSGMRPDGVECKDCIKTIQDLMEADEEVPEKHSPRSPDVIRFGCRV